jgi:hypothetical protein
MCGGGSSSGISRNGPGWGRSSGNSFGAGGAFQLPTDNSIASMGYRNQFGGPGSYQGSQNWQQQLQQHPGQPPIQQGPSEQAQSPWPIPQNFNNGGQQGPGGGLTNPDYYANQGATTYGPNNTAVPEGWDQHDHGHTFYPNSKYTPEQWVNWHNRREAERNGTSGTPTPAPAPQLNPQFWGDLESQWNAFSANPAQWAPGTDMNAAKLAFMQAGGYDTVGDPVAKGVPFKAAFA